MRLKTIRFDETESTVFSLTLWDTEISRIPDIEKLLDVAIDGANVVDRLHAMIMIAKKIEDRYAKTKESQANGRAEVPIVPADEAITTTRTVPV